MSTSERNESSHWKLLNVLLIGVLIPLLAAVIPILIDHYSPSSDLRYTFTGPIASKSVVALSLSLTNSGRHLEEGIEISLPFRYIPQLDLKTKPDGSVSTDLKKPQVTIESTLAVQDRFDEKNDVRILSIDRLRPGESVTISIVVQDAGLVLSEYGLQRLRIVSREALATLDAPSETLQYIYQTGFWLFVLFFALFLLYGIYYEWLMPDSKKEKYLLAQIDKLSRRSPPSA